MVGDIAVYTPYPEAAEDLLADTQEEEGGPWLPLPDDQGEVAMPAPDQGAMPTPEAELRDLAIEKFADEECTAGLPCNFHLNITNWFSLSLLCAPLLHVANT